MLAGCGHSEHARASGGASNTPDAAVAEPAPADRAAPEPALADPAPPSAVAPPAADAATWAFDLAWPSGERVALVGHAVGRGGWAIRDTPDGAPVAAFNVVTPTFGATAQWLAFEYRPVGSDGWQLALACARGDAFLVVATTEYEGAAWADWAVASPDGSRVAAWVLDDEHALHLLERDGDRLVVVERRHAEAVKAFPSFAPNGRLAARLPIRGEPLRFANAIDGVVGPLLDAVREVRFDARGERWAYAGCRGDAWFVFAGTGAVPSIERGPFAEVAEFDLTDGVRARVRDASGWRWIELDPR